MKLVNCQLYAPAAFTPRRYPWYLIFARVWVDLRGIMQSKGLSQWKIPVTPSVIEPALVACGTKRQATAPPRPSQCKILNTCELSWSQGFIEALQERKHYMTFTECVIARHVIALNSETRHLAIHTFCDVMLCSCVNSPRRFEGSYCLLLFPRCHAVQPDLPEDSNINQHWRQNRKCRIGICCGLHGPCCVFW
jgi:hypothetical protein